jgi:hypothetical protein
LSEKQVRSGLRLALRERRLIRRIIPGRGAPVGYFALTALERTFNA